MKSKRLFLCIAVALGLVAGGIVVSSMATTLNTQSSCLPSNARALAGLNFPVKQPNAASLPAGYQLRAMEDNRLDRVTMYFAGHPICRPNDRLSELANGTIIMEIYSGPNFANEQQMIADNTKTPLNSTTGQLIPQQVVDINGHKAIVIPQHQGTDRTTFGGKVIQEEPIQMPAEVLLFRGDVSSEYFFTADMPSDQLVTMAKSIQ